jgi:hypothetical protein
MPPYPAKRAQKAQDRSEKSNRTGAKDDRGVEEHENEDALDNGIKPPRSARVRPRPYPPDCRIHEPQPRKGVVDVQTDSRGDSGHARGLSDHGGMGPILVPAVNELKGKQNVPEIDQAAASPEKPSTGIAAGQV